MNLSIEDLSDFGRSQLESDYVRVERRDGGKTSRADFALGWMAFAVRYKVWVLFTAEARARLESE